MHTCAPLASGPQMSCTWVFVGGVLVFCFVLAQGLLLAWASESAGPGDPPGVFS